MRQWGSPSLLTGSKLRLNLFYNSYATREPTHAHTHAHVRTYAYTHTRTHKRTLSLFLFFLVHDTFVCILPRATSHGYGKFIFHQLSPQR